MSTGKKYALLILGLIVILYIIPLGVRPMFVPDEARYAEVPREMLVTGNWVSPHIDGIRYFEKPVFGYWAIAAAMKLFGENNFAIRLPFALSVALTAFFIFSMVRTSASKNNDETAALAALIFLTTLEVYAVGTFCVLDSLLSCVLTGCMVFFYQATESSAGSRQEKKYLFLAGIFCGLAFLTKGFLAFTLPVLALVPYLVIRKRFRDIFRMAWLPIITAVLISLPWSILIHLREPRFWDFFFWNEHIHRFFAKNAQHKESFWYFFINAPLMFLPWLFLVPAALIGIFGKSHSAVENEQNTTRLITFSICWFVFPFLFFSASNGKLLTYILPCFPPFAILLSVGMKKGFEKGQTRGFHYGTLGAILLYSLLFFATVGLMIYTRFFEFNISLPETKTWKWLMAANGLAVMVIFFIAALRNDIPGRKILLFGLAPVLLLFLANFIMPNLTLEKKAPDLLLQRHKDDIGQNSIILSSEETVHNVCWEYKREDIFIIDSPGELRFGTQFPEAKTKILDLQQARRLIEENKKRSVLIVTMKDYKKWQDFLPHPSLLDSNGPKGYVFIKF